MHSATQAYSHCVRVCTQVTTMLWLTVGQDRSGGESDASTGITEFRHGYYPGERLHTFRLLLEDWPGRRSKQLDLALSYYLDSILDQQRMNPTKAYLSAAIAAEVLLDSPRTARARTFRQRGTHLVAVGEDCGSRASSKFALYLAIQSTPSRGRA